mmetsp:Transcript_1437/g.3056  ORF Transcript_1437/g.3056 Transcript_1437/m.3056 type:complete len:170 (-) Transcript_1437:2215-2724(-)
MLCTVCCYAEQHQCQAMLPALVFTLIIIVLNHYNSIVFEIPLPCEDFEVFHNLLHNPDVSHDWFKFGLATSIAVMAIKAYVELYEGKKKKKSVDYKNFKSVTHWTLLLIIASWISFHMAICPVYGFFKTWLIMVGFGYGILIQSALMIPVWGQNFISVVLMTFFLQQYK